MKYNILLILVLVLSLHTSCKKDAVEVTPELIIRQEGELLLPYKGAHKNVEIVTNQDKLVGIAQDAWLSIKVKGKILELKASDNTSPLERGTKVQVIAGGVVRSFSVRQASAMGTLELGFPPHKLDQYGGLVTIDVSSNTDDWKASTEADWVTLTPNYKDGILAINVAENTARTGRSAVIDVTTSGITKSFEVSQEGIVYYLVPMTVYAVDINELMEFEGNRKSALIASPTSKYLDGYYRFQTRSPIFRDILYKWNGRFGIISEAVILLPEDKPLTDELKADMMNFFRKANGDDPMIDLGNVYFAQKLWTDIRFGKWKDREAVILSFVPRQEKLPEDLVPKRLTFAPSFELDKTSPEEVDAYMKTFSGKIDAEKSSDVIKHYISNKKITQKDGTQLTFDIHHRFTFGAETKTLDKVENNDPVMGSYAYLPDYAKGVDFFLTAEFRKLLHDEGYVFESRTASIFVTKFVYNNASRKVKLLIYPRTDNKYVSKEKMEKEKVTRMVFIRTE